MLVNMTGSDRSELTLLSNGRPLEVLAEAITQSYYSFVYTHPDLGPVALGGLCAVPAADISLVWMVAASNILYHHRKSFLKTSREETTRLLAIAPRLQAKVDRRWNKSIKWLRWLGYEQVGEFELMRRPGVVMEVRRADL